MAIGSWLRLTIVAGGLIAAAGGRSSPFDGKPLAKAFRDGLKQQKEQELEERGESVTIMAVGEAGLGKTSLLSSIFLTELVWPEHDGGATTHIVEQTVAFDLEGVPFTANLIDTPGCALTAS